MNEAYENLMSLFLYDQESMTPEQVEELSQWILQRPENARVFIHNALLHRTIHNQFICSDYAGHSPFPAEAAGPLEDVQLLSSEIWQLLSADEKNAPAVELPSPPKEPVSIKQASPERVLRPFNTFSRVSAIVSLAAVLFMIAYVQLIPVAVHEDVATLTDTIQVQWGETGSSLENGSRLSTNTAPIVLNKGLLKLTFDNHTSVVVEGPAEFVLVAQDQIKLSNGRLYASVPPEAIGFTVTTPNSKIIDLGTEFGVQVDYGETTQLHVVKGRTTVVAGPDGFRQTLQVNEGRAKKISSRSSDIQDIQCDKELFVRDIRSEHNMIWRGQALELDGLVQSGPWVAAPAHPGRGLESPSLAPGEFYPIENNPFVEGVFVPNGINGPVPVTQDGRLTWAAPAMEARQKIGYLRFDIEGVGGDRTGATLAVHVRQWAGKEGQIRVYGLKDGDADFWDEANLTYNTAAGCIATTLGRYALDAAVLENLGTMTLAGARWQRSNPSELKLDAFVAADTNGLLTLLLVRERNDLSAEWLMQTKEAGESVAPKLTFPDAPDDVRDVSTAIGRGADTYLSNDNQYGSTGPDDSHGSERVFKIRNLLKNKAHVLPVGPDGVPDDPTGMPRGLTVDGVVCGTADAPAIGMRANSGITFDLQQIRRCFDPGPSLKSFTAICGAADVSAFYRDQRQWNGWPQAGFYVLVDGHERFARETMTAGEKPGSIEIALTPQDRYLTLVVTGGTDRKAPMDWGVFVRPRLDLE